MAEQNLDDERFSVIIDFFKRNKTILLSTVTVIFIVAVMAVSLRSYNATQNTQAAEFYDLWFSSLEEEGLNPKETIEHFNTLQEKYSNTGYAQLALMVRGSQLARDGDLDGGLKNFQELLKASSGLFGNDVLNSLARISIARIELSRGNYSNVLEVLENLNSDSEHPMAYEVKGDALVGLEKDELALNQYSLALRNMQDESQKSLLKIKINKLNQ